MLKIVVSRDEFLKSLQVVEKAISENNIRPVISGAYIEARDGKAFIRGTDLELTITTNVTGAIEEEGRVVFSYKLVDEYLRQIRNEKIRLVEEDGNFVIDIPSGKSEFSIYTAAEYPVIRSLEDGIEYTIDKSVFLKALEKTRIGAENTGENISISCLRMEIEENKLKMIASDSFRMVYYEKPIDQETAGREIKVSIPLKTVDSLIKILKVNDSETIKIKHEGSQIAFKIGETIILSRIIELGFPNYKGVLQSFNFDKKVYVRTDDFVSLLKRVQIFARNNSDSKNGGMFNFSGKKLILKAISQDAKIKDEMEILKEGDDLDISLNVKFLLDFLMQFEEETTEMRMSNKDGAVLLKSEKSDDFVYLTMPLAL